MVARSIALTTLSALFIGCATGGNFESSSSPDAATLTFVNKSAHAIKLRGFVNGDDCSGGMLVFNDLEELPSAQSTSTRIDPEQKFSFYFSIQNKPDFGYFCIFPITFEPRRGEEYVASFDLIGSSAEDVESKSMVPPTSPKFGFSVQQSLVDAANFPGTNLFFDKPGWCYGSVVRIENGEFFREHTFVGRKWRQPVMSYSERQCY